MLLEIRKQFMIPVIIRNKEDILFKSKFYHHVTLYFMYLEYMTNDIVCFRQPQAENPKWPLTLSLLHCYRFVTSLC